MPPSKKHMIGNIVARADSSKKLKQEKGRDARQDDIKITRACCHVFCRSRTDKSISVPLDRNPRRNVLIAVGRDNYFIKTAGQKRLSICVRHLIDVEGRAHASNIYPLCDDPVVLGDLPGRNAVGDKWVAERAAAEQPKRKTTALQKRRESDINTVTTNAEAGEEMLQRLALLEAELAETVSKNRTLNKSNAAYKKRLESLGEPLQRDLPLRFESRVPKHVEDVRYSYDWLMQNEKKCEYFTKLKPELLKSWFQMCRELKFDVVYTKLRGNKPNIKFDFVEASCLLMVRACRVPQIRTVAYNIGNISHGCISRTLRKIVVVMETCLRLTYNRPNDRSLMEKHRAKVLQGKFADPASDFGHSMHDVDGMKVCVCSTSNPHQHCLIHNNHKGGPSMQALVSVDAMNTLGPTSGFYTGNASESNIFIYSGMMELLNFKEGDSCITDKGLHIDDVLQTRYQAKQTKPCNMLKGKMSVPQATKSAQIAQVRARSEWAVNRYESWQIFKTHQWEHSELSYADAYLEFTRAVMNWAGPLPCNIDNS